jgi:Fic family protein
MTWNWQQSDWPLFRWDKDALAQAEAEFLTQSGIVIGSMRHLQEEDRSLLVVDLITGEAIKTSEIEGEYLNRESVQTSILRNFGLKTDNRRASAAERGIADMMSDLYQHFSKPLTHSLLFDWHRMLSNGRQDLKDIGSYREHADPMQVVSGRLDKPLVHFQAPPSSVVKKEMDAFLLWWNESAPGGSHPLPVLTRTGIAHFYFVCIHPFEDGNGRIARALAEKSLAEYRGEPTLIAISHTIECNRKAYYRSLELNNKKNEITDWLVYFANTILEAQRHSLELINFLIEKTKLYDRVRGKLNERQEKVLARVFREGPEGFKGGLSAEKYIKITGTSRATSTRDLQDLVAKNVLYQTGERKSTRYYLKLNFRKD